MNWKKYKSLDMDAKKNEAFYIIGLDIGNDSSGIAYYNMAENAPETIDLSGGYGKPSIPTVMQYISETKEWVFGEYAVLNRGAGTEITLSALIERLGHFDYIDVDHKSVSVAAVLALFIKEILSSVKNINPKAEIVGIVATVPAYFSEQAHEEFQRAFKHAGYEKELISLVADRECVLANHYRSVPENNEKTLLLDFGSRELRGGLYEIKPNAQDIIATSMSSVFDDEISTSKINKDVTDMFAGFVFSNVKTTNQTQQLNEHISAFTYQHKDMIFQKNITQKPIKLYFNFAYPPFQQAVDNAQAQELIRPYAARFDRFINDVLQKSLYESEVKTEDITTVLCVGGGFEMLWAKAAINKIFSKEQTHFYKNPKMTTAEGAAIVAAKALNAPGTTLNEDALPQLKIEDKHQLTNDIGISHNNTFLPLVERNAFWWQKHISKLILINQEVTGELSFNITERSPTGKNHNLGTVLLEGLPTRPKGTTRLEVGVSFASNIELTLSVKDKGFGDLFPQVDYEQVVGVTRAFGLGDLQGR